MARKKHETVHETREQAQRENEVIHEEEDEPWIQPASLKAPPARKGMRQRWVRVGSLGKDDPVNSMRKFREGWKPRPADTIPNSYNYPKIQSGAHAGFIGVEGMLLCEMPESRAKKREQFFRDRNNARTDAVNQQLESVAGGKAYGPARIVENKSVRLREVRVAPDQESE